MKKTLLLLCAGILIFSLNGCFGAQDDESANSTVEPLAGDDLYGVAEGEEENVVYADPAAEIEFPTEVPVELEQPTTPPPTSN